MGQGLNNQQNQIQQAKESMKELKQMVETEQAKKMGYAEFNVCKKLRDTFRKRDAKSNRVFRELKSVVNKQEGGRGESDHRDDRDRDDSRDKDKDSRRDKKDRSSRMRKKFSRGF